MTLMHIEMCIWSARVVEERDIGVDENNMLVVVVLDAKLVVPNALEISWVMKVPRSKPIVSGYACLRWSGIEVLEFSLVGLVELSDGSMYGNDGVSSSITRALGGVPQVARIARRYYFE